MYGYDVPICILLTVSGTFWIFVPSASLQGCETTVNKHKPSLTHIKLRHLDKWTGSGCGRDSAVTKNAHVCISLPLLALQNGVKWT